MATKSESAKGASGKKTVRVHIFDHGDGELYMEPGHAVVERGGKILWENLSDDDVHLVLPTARLFRPPTATLDVEPGTATRALNVLPNASKGGHVYMGIRRAKSAALQLVRGGSNPVIIIR